MYNKEEDDERTRNSIMDKMDSTRDVKAFNSHYCGKIILQDSFQIKKNFYLISHRFITTVSLKVNRFIIQQLQLNINL